MGPDDELFTQVTVCAGALPEGEAIRLTQEVRNAVVGVGVEAGVSLGENQQGLTTFGTTARGSPCLRVFVAKNRWGLFYF